MREDNGMKKNSAFFISEYFYLHSGKLPIDRFASGRQHGFVGQISSAVDRDSKA
jgi:hypothetical protein